MSSRRSNRGDGAKGVNPHEHVAKTSWWVPLSAPSDRANFMAEAAARALERQHLDNIRESKTATIHLWRNERKP